MASIVLAMAIIALMAGSGYAAVSLALPDAAQSPLFDYLVTILMENKDLNNIYGSHCSGNCTYITQLANQYGLAKNYSSVAFSSLPNYLTLTSGGNYDRPPFDRDCFPENQTTGCYVSGANIIDSIVGSGRSWKAYFEDYKGGCSLSPRSSNYTNSHNPFVYYTDIYTNSTRCNRIVNANPSGIGFLAVPTALFSDLNSASTASNYMWLTPNICDDGHSRCTMLNNTVSQANLYLSEVVPKILNSELFATQRAALLVTWDEPNSPPNNIVAAIWAGSAAKFGYKSTSPYTHYSATKTAESSWSLPSLYPSDATATPMSEFFLYFPASTLGGGVRPPLRLAIRNS